MKSGASPNDIKMIRKLYDKGEKAENIAQYLNLPPNCVKSFEPETLKETKKKVKDAEAAQAKEHKAKVDKVVAAKAS